MVRALLAGTKTQTRRLMKPQPLKFFGSFKHVATRNRDGAVVFNAIGDNGSCLPVIPGPPHCVSGEFVARYGIGDRLYVRENAYFAPNGVAYAADNKPLKRGERVKGFGRQTPSIHMPRWASRLTLIISDVRVQRLCEISEADAKAEGASFHGGRGIGHSGWRHDLKDVHDTARSSFARLWNDINGPDAWKANPWVIAVSFTVHKTNIDAMAREKAA
jgi:hypothetical protein